jgi:transglutaminase-like putative cysteine protease
MRIHIEHLTRYVYERPVRFGTHRLVLRPRESHDLRVDRMDLRIEPAHRLHWIRDVFGNSIALVDWLSPADVLTIVNDVTVERFAPFPGRDLQLPWQVPFPPAYEAAEAGVVSAYQSASFRESAQAVQSWLADAFTPDTEDAEGTMLRLCGLVFKSVAYQNRGEKGVQSPDATLDLATGSCRDMATLMMDAARALGVAARFASGYLHGAASIAGRASTHAWTEVYLPTLGWRGFDPTLGTAVSMEHVAIGVSSHPRGVMPVTGAFIGGGADYKGLEVRVKTEQLPLMSGKHFAE